MQGWYLKKKTHHLFINEKHQATYRPPSIGGRHVAINERFGGRPPSSYLEHAASEHRGKL